MAVAGPERSGSGTGVPVPSSTTLVRVVCSFGGWLAGCWAETASAISSGAAQYMTRVIFIASSCGLLRSPRLWQLEHPDCRAMIRRILDLGDQRRPGCGLRAAVAHHHGDVLFPVDAVGDG